MRRASYSLAIAVLVFSGALSRPAPAQSYTPKSIRFVSTEPSQPLDNAELLRISGLQQGAPLTKDDILAALQKLGDSGAFENLSYSVNETALTIKLNSWPKGRQAGSPSASSTSSGGTTKSSSVSSKRKSLCSTARFLPLQGNQTGGEVEEALIALLRDKGIADARVTALPSSESPTDPMNAVALSISSPEILVGQVQFGSPPPDVVEKLTTFAHALTDRNFDLRETSTTIRSSTQSILSDAGYLDATLDPLVFAPPRKDLGSYVVDIQTSIHPGPLYHIGSIVLHPEPPLTDSDLRVVLPFKTGQTATAEDVRNAVTVLALVYGDRGFLEARASANLDKNVSNHTVNYSFSFSPGVQFHLASIDASALSPELQQEFSSLWHVAPGALVDKPFQDNLRSTLEKLHTRMGIYVAAKRNPDGHTVVIMLQLRKLPGISDKPDDPVPVIVPTAPPPSSQLPTPRPPLGPPRRRP